MSTSHRAGGFSLVELSIVVLLIGLLAGGVFAGKNLIDGARMQNVANDFLKLKSAIANFTEVQHYYPGDFPDASKDWGAADGNGDWMISTAESAHVMNHLHDAGDVETAYAGGGALTPGQNLMAAAVKPAAYWTHTHTSAIQGKTGEAIDLAARGAGSSVLEDGALTPDRAYALDVKIDDGSPVAGDLYASKGAAPGAEDCLDAASPPVYLPNADVPSCRMHLWISHGSRLAP
ncbi:MAG: prepilin-type N-terminal cleavage/methylation domain-containing protein [Rickettsiales bacterium]